MRSKLQERRRKLKQPSRNQNGIFHYKSHWFWLFIFAIIYCMGFWLLLPTSNHSQNQNRVNIDPLESNIKTKNDLNVNINVDNNDAEEEINANNKFLDENHQILHALVPELGTPLEVDKNDPDFDPKYDINNERVTSKLIPLYKPWGHKYSNRLMCMIITLWPARKEKMDIIHDTYGTGCDKLVWVVDAASNPPKSYAGHDFFIIHLKREQGKELKKRNIWEKVHTMWATVYKTKLTDLYDWFIKADDDTFIITENMKGFLQYYDPNYPHYLGHTLRSRWEYENVVFNSGVCYVLSKATLKRIGPYLSHLPTLHSQTGRSHCIDRDGAGEDPTTGICLSGVGIRPGNTLDHNMKERFLIFRPEDHNIIFREDTWYWKYKPPNVKEGTECCSQYIVCAHNYKDMGSVKKWYPILQKKYNSKKNWDNIPLPPRPRTFVYDSKQVKFNIDNWFNVDNPPKGQRIFKGPEKNNQWICWNCNIGDKNDPYWTEWWDKDELKKIGYQFTNNDSDNDNDDNDDDN